MTLSTNIFSLFSSKQKLRDQIAADYERLYRIAWSWTHDQYWAEDLVQDTMARALEKIDSLKNQERLEVWLTRILSNRFRDQLKARKEHSELDESLRCENDEPAISADRAQLIERTRIAVGKLNEEHRQVLTLVDLAEFSYAETANILEVPVGTVMSRLARARENLRKHLEFRESDLGHVVPLRKPL